MDLTPKFLVGGAIVLVLPHFIPGASNNFFSAGGPTLAPHQGRLLGAFLGGQGGEEEDRKQRLYKYLRVFAKTPDSPSHAGNYVTLRIESRMSRDGFKVLLDWR